jgi:hypothetical protein
LEQIDGARTLEEIHGLVSRTSDVSREKVDAAVARLVECDLLRFSTVRLPGRPVKLEAHDPSTRSLDRLSAPINVIWEPTLHCNLSCDFCYNASGPSADRGDRRAEAVRQFSDSGAFQLTLVGGEPMMLPDFYELIDQAEGLGMSTEFGASITDVPGVRVGHATDRIGQTGVTVALFDQPALGAAAVLGPAATTRGFESLHPRGMAKPVHAVCFTGGSTFGLGATGGVQRFLRERDRGMKFGDLTVPLVPSAAIFELRTGEPGRFPDEQMGYAACQDAGTSPASGSVGAATGALVGKVIDSAHAMAGGIGMASIAADVVVVGALAVVNALGDVRDPDTGALLAGSRRSPDSLDLLENVGGAARRPLGIPASRRAHHARPRGHDGEARSDRMRDDGASGVRGLGSRHLARSVSTMVIS